MRRSLAVSAVAALLAGGLFAGMAFGGSGHDCRKHHNCPPPTTTTTTTGTTSTTPVGTYFGTDPSANCTSRSICSSAFPRDAAGCAASIIRNPWEPRPENAAANQTVGDGSYVWNTSPDTLYWTGWVANRAKAQGQFTGTTTEHFSWAACRWGIDEDLLRAVAVQESHWSINDVGDVCGPVGEASYGLTQIKNRHCDGTIDEGGYPDTIQSTALDVDYYGAKIRSCYDGLFYDGGSWLYGGQTVGQIASVHGWDYVLWGCVGYWYSGSWYDTGAQTYISQVKAHLANRDWTAY